MAAENNNFITVCGIDIPAKNGRIYFTETILQQLCDLPIATLQEASNERDINIRMVVHRIIAIKENSVQGEQRIRSPHWSIVFGPCKWFTGTWTECNHALKTDDRFKNIAASVINDADLPRDMRLVANHSFGSSIVMENYVKNEVCSSED